MTTKQRGFVNDCARGLQHTEAYGNNYDVSRMNPNTIKRRAYELFKQFESEIEELKQKAIDTAEKDVIADVQEVLIFYTNLMRGHQKKELTVKETKKTSKIDKETKKVLRSETTKYKKMLVNADLSERIEGAKGLERVLVGSKVIIDKQNEIDLTGITPEQLIALSNALTDDDGD